MYGSTNVDKNTMANTQTIGTISEHQGKNHALTKSHAYSPKELRNSLDKKEVVTKFLTRPVSKYGHQRTSSVLGQKYPQMKE